MAAMRKAVSDDSILSSNEERQLAKAIAAFGYALVEEICQRP